MTIFKAERGVRISPWRLTTAEAEVMDLLVQHGSRGLAARARGCSTNTVEALCHRANERIGARTTLLCALEWDRWRRAARPLVSLEQVLPELTDQHLRAHLLAVQERVSRERDAKWDHEMSLARREGLTR